MKTIQLSRKVAPKSRGSESRKEKSEDSFPVHKYPIILLESHLDTFGHVNNATYLTLFEEARWDLITNNGLGLPEILKNGQGPVILRIALDFKKELRLRQRVQIETRILSCQKKLTLVLQEIKDSEGQVFCRAEFTLGLFDLRKRKLIPITPEWRQALQGR